MGQPSHESVMSLKENPKEIFLETTSILIKLIDNILHSPENPKFRSIRLGNENISQKIIPAIGAMECLFDLGFEEGDDNLILPKNVPLEHLKDIRDEILNLRENLSKGEETNSESCDHNSSVVKTSDTTKHVYSNSFLKTIQAYSRASLKFDNSSTKAKARNCIPLEDLEAKAQISMRMLQKNVKSRKHLQEASITDLLLLELLSWFKNSFFKWIDRPICDHCSNETSPIGKIDKPNCPSANRIEVYKCQSCSKKTHFPRYTDLNILLKTRKGRCGEWASCFTLLCRSLGWDARHVIDETDHAWTEVYSITQGRWLHCDPCENACDSPLMYENGWRKKLTYIMAYSPDDIQDVTWRYTSDFSGVLQRRVKCSEEHLLHAIFDLRQERQAHLSAPRREFLKKRCVRELAEFLTPPSAEDGTYQGRTSGSLLWRLSRGETLISGNQSSTSYIWKPNEMEISNHEMHISYSCSQDKYLRSSNNTQLMGWENGVSNFESIFRKEEQDWKMCYLSRKEGAKCGNATWMFDLSESGFIVDHVKIKVSFWTFENGNVSFNLCSGDKCIPITTGNSFFETSTFQGCQKLALNVRLDGGKGDAAWQHAQLFRQELDDLSSVGLDITIKMKEK